MRFILFALAATLALPAGAQTQPIQRTIFNLPTCDPNNDGVMVIATDPQDGDDCTNGSGTAEPHPCVCDGDAGTWRRTQRDSLVWPAPWDGIAIGSDGQGAGMVLLPVDRGTVFEPALDDGRDRAGAALCSTTFCSTVDCGAGQGDCENDDTRCLTGLHCRQNVGRLHDTGDEVCTTTTDICRSTEKWCEATCTADDPCTAGQGDCGGSDANCEAGLACGVDDGATFDCAGTVDVCQAPASVCDVQSGPLVLGQGNCTQDGDTACTGGAVSCVEDAGAYYGCAPTVDICESAL